MYVAIKLLTVIYHLFLVDLYSNNFIIQATSKISMMMMMMMMMISQSRLSHYQLVFKVGRSQREIATTMR